MLTHKQKCSACGHTRGSTHAQYTQCPANAAKNMPTAVDVPILSNNMADVQKMSHSSVDTAFMRFQALSVDIVKDGESSLTLEDLNVLWNLTQGRDREERLKVLNNIIVTASPSLAYEFYSTQLDPELDNDFLMVDRMVETAGPQLFEFMSKSGKSLIRYRVAESHNVPSDILYMLADDDDSRVRIAVAANPSTPPQALVALTHDNYEEVSDRVAGNPSAPAQALEHLSSAWEGDAAYIPRYSHRRLCLQVSVGTHLNSPPELLTRLSTVDDRQVKCAVGANLHTLLKVLANLARDDDENVRAAVAGNPQVPAKVLRWLTKDVSPPVRAAVAGRKNIP